MSPYTYEFPRPALTADVLLVAGRPEDLSVLLIRRGRPPFQGQWALPGGFVDEGERVIDAARRELLEETGIAWDGDLLQVGAFGDPGRDPRGWTASVIWAAYVGREQLAAGGSDDAEAAGWFSIGDTPPLAFDHDDVLEEALARIRESGVVR